MNGLSLCSGVGGLELGLEAALAFLGEPYRTVAYVERDAYAREVIDARIRSGVLDEAPIFEEVETFNGTEWLGRVDIVSAGFPCQPWSPAGKGKGVDDERWLWPAIARVVCDVVPDFVFLENSSGLVTRAGVGHVLGSLAELGFDAEWACLRAGDVGASHERERVFILAYAHDAPRRFERGLEHRQRSEEPRRAGGDVAHAERPGPQGEVSVAHERGPRSRGRRREVADPDGIGRERRERGNDQGPAREVGRGDLEPQGLGPMVADSERREHERRGGSLDVARPRGEAQGEGVQRERGGDAARDRGEALAHAHASGRGERWPAHDDNGRNASGDDAHGCGPGMADPRSERSQGVDEAGAAPVSARRSDGEPMGDASGGGLGIDGGPSGDPGYAHVSGPPLLFAPGQDDPRWGVILQEWPFLTPAIFVALLRRSLLT